MNRNRNGNRILKGLCALMLAACALCTSACGAPKISVGTKTQSVTPTTETPTTETPEVTKTPTTGEPTVTPTPTDTPTQTPTPEEPTVTPDTTETPTETLPPTDDRSKELIITELMVRNHTTVRDAEGRYAPWVELHNASSGELDLRHFSISYEGAAVLLPDKTIAPDEYFVYFFDEEIPSTGIMTVYYKGIEGMSVVYRNPTPDRSFLPDTGEECSDPTPGNTLKPFFKRVLFSEVMPKNNVYPINGKLVGFVEFFNLNGEEVNLSDFYLTNDPNDKNPARLPDITVGPGKHAVVTEDMIDFNIKPSAQTLYLFTENGAEVDRLVCPDIEKDTSYSALRYPYATPGYPNTDYGYSEYLNERSGLLITEVMTSNSKYNQKNGEYYDMVELRNASGEKLWLGGYYLTDSKKDLKKYNLPDVTLEPGEYYVVYCAGTDYTDLCPLGLSSDGEFLAVSDDSGYVTDAFMVPHIPVDRSWGRGAGETVYFETPTFGKPNGSGYKSISAMPVLSIGGGFYANTFSVTFLNASAGTICYTTDGTMPTTESKRYAGESIPITKTMTVRAILNEEGKLPGEMTAIDYFIDIPDLTLPIVKMTVENEAMYGEKGIYTDYENRDAEAQGCVSLYENGELRFTMPCAFKVVGNYSRRYDKKSYQVKFRTRYGASKLKYDLFGDGEITEFKGFVLRSGSQDIPLAMMRDEFAQTVISGFTDTVLTQKYRPVSLFINDKYVGVYYIREKVNEDFVAAHYNVSPESVTIVANLMYREYGADASDWYSLWSFIKQNDLSVSTNYEYLAGHIDMNSVIDYYIALWWADNRDEGNTRIFRSTENDGKWRLLFYDADMGFGSYIQYKGKDSAQFLYGTYCAGEDGVNNALIYKLLRNATFRDLFLRRLNEWFEGALYDANVNAAIEKIRVAIDHDMHVQPYSDYNTWSNTRLPELRDYVLGRTEVMKKEIKGLLGLSDADMTKYFG